MIRRGASVALLSETFGFLLSETLSPPVAAKLSPRGEAAGALLDSFGKLRSATTAYFTKSRMGENIKKRPLLKEVSFKLQV
jgi:hypothetical protein